MNIFAPYYQEPINPSPRMTTISEPALLRLYEIERAAKFLLANNKPELIAGGSVLAKAVGK